MLKKQLYHRCKYLATLISTLYSSNPYPELGYSIKGEIQQIKEEIQNLKQSEKFLDLENQITRAKGSLKDNLRSTEVLRQEARDFNITETRTTIADALKKRRPRVGNQKDPVLVLPQFGISA